MTTLTRTEETRLYMRIYLALVALTGVTVGAYFFHFARVAAIAVTLAIASVKAGLIGWHFMHLKSARPLIWAIVLTGLTAVFILGIGILPDLGWRF